MLEENEIDYRYRECRESPLTRQELVLLLKRLEMTAKELLRSKEAQKLKLDPEIEQEALLDQMALHPTLVQRPIAIKGERAIIARPADRLLEFLELH